jgi:hypothetical protein
MFGDPARDAFPDFHPDVPDLSGVWKLGRAQDNLVPDWFQQIDQTRVASGDCDCQRYQFIQHFLQRHPGIHNPTDAV